jgi:hypothetical protein
MTSAAAWRGCGCGGGSAKRSGSAQRDGGSAVALARQRNVGGSLAAALWQWQCQRLWRQRDIGGGGSAPARRCRQHGGSTLHGAACGDVHRGCRCAATPATNANADTDDIVC